MIGTAWRVRTALGDIEPPSAPLSFDAAVVTSGRAEWLNEVGLEAGTPYLISPAFKYDVQLNAFFQAPAMTLTAVNTQFGYARDLAAFLTFLWSARRGRSWRDAVEADHLAYQAWRRRDPDGPRVAGGTWDREVAAVNRFYHWAVAQGHMAASPIPQVARRSVAMGGFRVRAADEQRPATYSHDAARDLVEWIPPESYRRWRETGVRGYDRDGLPRSGFRGRWAERNAVFCDLMVRSGLRLSKQAALTVLEVPVSGEPGYRRFWLPGRSRTAAGRTGPSPATANRWPAATSP
jgi:hypothetical protein